MRTILTDLHQIATKLLETLELEDMYKIIVHEGSKLVDARYGSIYLHTDSKLNRVYTTLPSNLQVTIRKKGFTYKAFQSRKITMVTIDKVIPVHSKIKAFEVKTIILIPLCYRNKCMGVLSFDAQKTKFSPQKMNLLKLYGTLATLALRQAHQYQEVQKAVQLRDLFISLTAHEFRTPLTTVSGYSQMLKKKLKKDNSSLVGWVEELDTEVARLTEMTNDLLQISRIKSGKIDYTFRECNFNEIINTAVKRFQFTFPDYSIEVYDETGQPYTIIGDSDKLLQVFTNILENAGKFSSPDKPIKITITKKKHVIVTTIQDFGRGIPQEDLEKIFVGFYKAANTDESQGMGLGLFIGKSIIDAHQGKLQVTSELNKWTRFSISLPVHL